MNDSADTRVRANSGVASWRGRRVVVVVVPSFLPSFLPSFVRSFLRSFVQSFVRSIVPSFLRSFVQSFVRSIVRSFIQSFVRSFVAVCLFISSLVRSFVRSKAPMFRRRPSFVPASVRSIVVGVRWSCPSCPSYFHGECGCPRRSCFDDDSVFMWRVRPPISGALFLDWTIGGADAHMSERPGECIVHTT